jgi:hypothetical protein
VSNVDASELDGLITDIEQIPRGLMREVERVTSRGSLNIKRDWARNWSGHSSIRHLPRAINYDVTREGFTVESEIGADHARAQGTLAHFIEFGEAEYGSLHNAPIPGARPALAAEEPRYERALADVAEKVWRGPRGR